jgi:hypothetical protein
MTTSWAFTLITVWNAPSAGEPARPAQQASYVTPQGNQLQHLGPSDAYRRPPERRVANCEGDTWQQVALKVGRLGHWEFEDYREAKT